MRFEDLVVRFEQAAHDFNRLDHHLITVDSSERSMTHALAVRLMNAMTDSGYDVDCEYNRDGFDAKKMLVTPEQIRTDEDEAKTVFPDIIVHKRSLRGTESNLLVVEAKKAARREGKDRDKIISFIEQLDYRFGLLLGFPAVRDGAFSILWFSKNDAGMGYNVGQVESRTFN